MRTGVVTFADDDKNSGRASAHCASYRNMLVYKLVGRSRMNGKSERDILVVGATGNQGGAVARKLRERGYKVRALCRDLESPAARALASMGVNLHLGDLEEQASIDSAVEGAYGVFGIQNFWQGFPATKLGTEGEIRQGKNLLDAARKAGVQHFIQSTGGGVTVAPELAVNQGKLAVEQYARTIGIPLTVMRPVFFMENFDNPAWGMPQSLQNGRLDLPFHPDTRLMMCAVADLAAFVAIAFDQPDEFIGCSFDVASDEMTMRDIASTFTRVMGRPVAFTGDPAGLDALAEMDADLAGIFRFEIFERGFRAFLPGLRALHPGLSQLEEYLRQKGWANR